MPHLGERTMRIRCETVVHHLGRLSGQDQVALPETGEVLGCRRLPQPDPEGDIARRAFTLFQLVQDRQPYGTGQQPMDRRLADRIEIPGDIHQVTAGVMVGLSPLSTT